MTQNGTDSAGGAAGNAPEYTVSELSGALKRTLEDAFGRVRVRGEVSKIARPSSGHAYLTLKDEGAVLEGVCFRTTFERLKFKPEAGLEVIVTGRVTAYASRSQYQIVIDRIEPAGIGALMAMLEERRRKLAAEGLFAEACKKPLPRLPDVIGVVTSPAGAVIRDILHRLRERFPRHVLLWPVPVQGEAAAGQIAAAIAGFNRLAPDGLVPRPDLIIVARGGGSLEDLWAFNEEAVVRAAAASAIPLISAVGHETDMTLIDHAADVRAPTPTAAAEIAVPVRADLLADIASHQHRLVAGITRRLREQRAELRAVARALRDPRAVIGEAGQRVDDLAGRLDRAVGGGLERGRHRLGRRAAGLRPAALRTQIDRERARLAAPASRLPGALASGVARHRAGLDRSAARLRRSLIDDRLAEWRRAVSYAALHIERDVRRTIDGRTVRLGAQAKLLEALSYHKTLDRGFALVRDGSGTPLQDAQAILPGMALVLEFRDGAVNAQARGESEALVRERPQPAARRRKREDPSRDPQGSLF